MKKFNFTLHEKVKVWKTIYCRTEANTLEEAIEKVKDGNYKSLGSQYIDETKELLTPEDNEDDSTIEIYDGDTMEEYYSNGL